jgi:phosphoenolpyruvate carboxylase
VAAVIAGKAALSEFYRFSKEEKLPVYPAIGVGTLPFRGSLSPERINDFMREYPGMKTVYVQSAFRYDFPLKTVRKAIRTLNTKLQKTKPEIYSDRELRDARELCEVFQKPYRSTVEGLAHTIHKKRLPRAIPFTGTLYTLGVPPEFIGAGRGLKAARAKGLDPERFYTNFKKDLVFAGRYLNKRNLAALSAHNKFFRAVETDIGILEHHFNMRFEPKTDDDLKHQELSATAYRNFRAGVSISNQIVASGKIRKSLG